MKVVHASNPDVDHTASLPQAKSDRASPSRRELETQLAAEALQRIAATCAEDEARRFGPWSL